MSAITILLTKFQGRKICGTFVAVVVMWCVVGMAFEDGFRDDMQYEQAGAGVSIIAFIMCLAWIWH